MRSCDTWEAYKVAVLGLWSKLDRFLDYPVLELSNNLAESSMRPVALGRKNWFHVDGTQAGPMVALRPHSNTRPDPGQPLTIPFRRMHLSESRYTEDVAHRWERSES